MKRKLAGLLAAVLALSALALPALAAEEPQPIPAWSYDILADAYALGLWEDGYYDTHADPVTEEDLEALCTAAGDKLALLGGPQGEGWPEEPFTGTRGDVLDALYRTAAGWVPADAGGYDYLEELGVVQGDGNGLSLERPCTLMEAVTLSTRLVLAVYDARNAGSLGLLWKATGKGNTLYLLGTAHVDRDNIYPFHRQLRDIITSADQVIFEVDFNDAEDAAAYAALQMYRDGTTLADHVSGELYQRAVEAGAALGLTEEQTALCKPWALALSFQALGLQDETTGSGLFPVDSYLNAKAVNAGVPVGAVETLVFQGGLFDTLSPEYQEASLAAALDLLAGGGGAMDQAAAEAADQEMTALVEGWKARDAAALEQLLDKEAILASGDELNVKLYAQRDPHMAAAADGYLSDGTGNTYLMAVGAGHMIGETGIVRSLIGLGYTVELVPVP